MKWWQTSKPKPIKISVAIDGESVPPRLLKEIVGWLRKQPKQFQRDVQAATAALNVGQKPQDLPDRWVEAWVKYNRHALSILAKWDKAKEIQSAHDAAREKAS